MFLLYLDCIVVAYYITSLFYYISRCRTVKHGLGPEVIRHESYSNMADVYSYAVVLWQLLSREDPFLGLSQIEAAGKVALERARPPFPRGAPHSVVDIISICWSENPSNRYPFEELCAILPIAESKLSPIEQQWIDAPLGHPVYNPRDGERHAPQTGKNQLPQRHAKKDSKSHNVPTQPFAPLKLTSSKKRDDKPRDEKKKSGFFKIKMFGS